MEAIEKIEPIEPIDQEKPRGVVEVHSDRQDAIAAGVIGVGLIAGLIGLIVFSIKEEKKQLAAEQQRSRERQARVQAKVDWINKEQEEGNAVHKLADGQYLVVDRQAKQRLVVW